MWNNVDCQGSDICPGVPWGSAAFAWHAWDKVHCQGVRCIPLRLRLFYVTGVAQYKLPRGLMYALVSVGIPPLLCARCGRMCIAKRYNICVGVFWAPFFYVSGMGQGAVARDQRHAVVSPGAPSFLHIRLGTMYIARGFLCIGVPVFFL